MLADSGQARKLDVKQGAGCAQTPPCRRRWHRIGFVVCGDRKRPVINALPERGPTFPETTHVIEVQHLTKRYGPFTAVSDISFSVERGEILGFLGPNGAGKTTTMRVITGYMPPTDGKALVAGYDVMEQPIEAKRRTGYLPETPPLYPDMTVRDYLMFCSRIKGVASADRKSRIGVVMERTRVSDM